jgi:hypothetical protein
MEVSIWKLLVEVKGLGKVRARWRWRETSYSCTSRPDGIEHVGSQGYGNDEVFRVTLRRLDRYSK